MRTRSKIALGVLALLAALIVVKHAVKLGEQEPGNLSSSSTSSSLQSEVTSSKPQTFSLKAGTYDQEISFDGEDRQYRVHVPSSYTTASPMPVVIAFHGGGGDIESAVRSMQWDETADANGFIAVYPQGTGKSLLGKIFGTWNGGICCGLAVQNKVDDVGFTRAMLDQLSKDFHVDQKRVYATGISNGGMMSYRLACDLSDRIAAIGPVAGQFDGGQNCDMERPVPILHLHGLADPCTKMEGGTCGGCFNDYLKALRIPAEKNDTWQCTSVESTVATWARRNGCSQQTSVVSNKNGVKCISYDCSASATTELCTIEEMGHQWPGGDNEAPSCKTKPNGLVCREWKNTVGPESDALSANDALWSFFKAHPMK